MNTDFSIKDNPRPALLIPGTRGVQFVLLSELIRIQSISNYSKLFFSTGKTLVVAKTLSAFDDQLTGQGFIRVHRTHLVNRDFVSRYYSHPKMEIELLSGERIEISRRKKQEVKNYFTAKVITLNPLKKVVSYKA